MSKLTVKEIESLIRKGERIKVADIHRLYFCIPNSGKPFWTFRYSINDKRKERTIAKHSEMTLAEVRALAAEYNAQLEKNIDPFATTLQSSKSIKNVDALFQDYYENKLVTRTENPEIPKSKFLNNVSPIIGHLNIDQVEAIHVRNILHDITNSGRPTVSNDVLDLLKNLFKHAAQLDITMRNPAAAFTYKDAGGYEAPRKRALSINEIEHAFKVFQQNSETFTRDNYLACCLLVALGVRKSELLKSQWSEFDLDNRVWHLPKERTKKKFRAIDIPLPPLVLEWLNELKIRSCDSLYVFPSRRKSKRPHVGADTLNNAINTLFGRVSKNRKQPHNLMVGIEHFRVHDLRRTFRSLAASLRFRDDVCERCLNHKIDNLDLIYNLHDYFDERMEVHTAICETLSKYL